MNNLHELANRLMRLDDRLADCMRCGLCQAVCPMFGATGFEADVARGKLALVGNLAHEIIKDPQAIADKLGRCLLCGSCQSSCPPGVKIIEVFMEAREIVHEYLGLHPVKKMIFRTLLAKPNLFNFAIRIGAPMQRLFFKNAGTAQKTVCSPMLSFMLGDRHIRSLARKSLTNKYGAINESNNSGEIKVAFFPGCMGDKMYVEMAEACLKVLRHHKVSIYMPTGLACCGIPALSSGDAKGMCAQMSVNLPLLSAEKVDYVITPCASCTSTIKYFWTRYAERIDSKAVEQAREISSKTMDINEFLVKVLKVEAVDQSTNSTKVTYHDPCHLKKSLGISVEPRIIIKSNQRYNLVEMKEADRCCGCGGSFNLFHYDYSSKIGQRKRNNVVESGAQVVATGCPACMMQLEDALSRNNDKVLVKHVVELYAETL